MLFEIALASSQPGSSYSRMLGAFRTGSFCVSSSRVSLYGADQPLSCLGQICHDAWNFLGLTSGPILYSRFSVSDVCLKKAWDCPRSEHTDGRVMKEHLTYSNRSFTSPAVKGRPLKRRYRKPQSRAASSKSLLVVGDPLNKSMIGRCWRATIPDSMSTEQQQANQDRSISDTNQTEMTIAYSVLKSTWVLHN